MPLVKLDTGFNIEVEFAVAPFAKRMLAWIIDVLVCWMITKGLATIARTDSFFVWTSVWDLKGMLISLPVLFYHLFFEIILNGRSPGKLAMNLKVVTEEGGHPTISQYLIRWVFRWIDFPYWILYTAAIAVVPWLAVPLIFVGLISVIATEKSQRLGDIVAGTIVIDMRNQVSWQDTVFTELSETYKPKYPQVMQLSDRDINTLKSIIETVKKKNDQDLARRIAERIQSKVKIETEDYPIDFLETLLMDYNYYSAR